jgi:hypothetical protein
MSVFTKLATGLSHFLKQLPDLWHYENYNTVTRHNFSG